MCSNLQRGTNKKVIASPFVHLMKYDNGNKCYHHLCWQCSQCWRTPGHFFFIITRINSSKKILNKIQNCNTLFETFIFCPKIKLSFPEKIVDFLGRKNRENVVVLDFLAVDNFDFTRKIVKNILGENVGVWSKLNFRTKI
mgnify:CR=1 FL=1